MPAIIVALFMGVLAVRGAAYHAIAQHRAAHHIALHSADEPCVVPGMGEAPRPECK